MITSAETYTPFALQHEGVLALSRAEQYGIQVDVPYCLKVEKHLERQIKYYQELFQGSDLAYRWKKIYGSGLNFNSDHQLANVLFKNMKIEPKKHTANGNPSTDEEALSALGIAEIDYILKIRHLDKVKSTYIGAFIREQVNGILHPNYNLHIPVTFRSSSSNPNFHNIPNRDPVLKKLCRKAIIARKGHKLLCVDYGGIEVKIAACYHKDPTMMLYINDTSKDMHRDTAMDCFLIDDPLQIVKAVRHTAKNMFVFPEFYGDWYKSCAESMWIAAQSPTHVLANGMHLTEHLARKKIKTYEQFENNIKRVEDLFWFERFPVYTQWKEDWWEAYCKRGYIDMYTGFRCHGVLGRNDCINYPVQGAAFHCLLLAFILLDRIQFERKWKTRLIAQIHDEVILDVHPSEEKEVLETVNWVMCHEVPRIFNWINVPLIAEAEITGIDGSWCDKKPPEDD